jgi:RNA polymerase sigma factor (sigma-70 family)
MPHSPEPPAPDLGSNLRDLPDDALLAGFARSDPAAAPLFVDRFQRRVFGLAFTILGDARAAEDAAQEAFLRAWRRADVFDPRRGTVLTWLLTITRNAAIDSLRARRARTVDLDELLVLLPDLSARDPADAAIVRDDMQRLRRAITRLPNAQRRAVVLAGIWGLSAREVAEHEEIPLGTAKTRIRIALRRLRIALVRDAQPHEPICT